MNEPDDTCQSLGSVTMLLHGICHVDEAQTKEFWDLFFPRMVRVANKTLACHADAEDAAQEALVKFWQKAQEGEVPLDLNRFEIWTFLSTMTNRQAIDFLRKKSRQKRGGGNVQSESALVLGSDAGEHTLDGLVGELSFHDFDLVLDELLDALEEDLKTILICRMMGYTNGEIAEMVGCSERHVRRQVEELREQLQGCAGKEEGG
jgi:RNA polymerase sigma factor (sigma-70 family)